MTDVSNLSIAQQKLIFETVLMLTVALQTIGEETKVDSQVLQQKLSNLVKNKMMEMSDEQIRQGVKEFFEANANRSFK